MTTPEATLQPALDSELAQTAAPALPMWQGWLPWLAAALATTVLFYALRVYVIVALEAVLLMMNGTYRKGQKRKAYSRGNYRPQLQEMDPTECKVLEGSLPADLNGAFLRNGPNPPRRPLGDYHWFDGEGQIKVLRIKGGTARYSNKWVRSTRFLTEQKAGMNVFMRIGDFNGAISLIRLLLIEPLKRLLGVIPRGKGGGAANTALVYHANKILALEEGDLPYQLRMLCSGLVDQWQRMSELQSTWGESFTAHPKRDYTKDELHIMRYMVTTAPYCQYGVLDAAGRLKKKVPVAIPKPVMMHDMAISDKYALFLDLPLEFEPEKMVKLKRIPFFFNQRPSRIGVLPKDTADGKDIVWFENPDPKYCFHIANAWDDGTTVKMAMSVYDSMELDYVEDEVMRDGGQKPAGVLPKMCIVSLDMSPEAVEGYRLGKIRPRFEFSPMHSATMKIRGRDMVVSCEFPRIRDQLTGQKAKYAYAAQISDQGGEMFIALHKFDLLEASGGDNGHIVATAELEEGASCGEPVFAPREGGADEDDGYVLAFVHTESTEISEVRVWDAKDLSMVARVSLPQRAPYGFHGMWLTESEVQEHVASGAASVSRPKSE